MLNVSSSALADHHDGPRVEPHIVIRTKVDGTKASALVDSAANSCFVSSAFAQLNKLPLFPLSTPRTLSLADKSSSRYQVTHFTTTQLSTGDIQPHNETLTAYVADLQYDVILGRPWLSHHQPQTRWQSGTVILDSQYCRENCLHHSTRPVIAVSTNHTWNPALRIDSTEYDLRSVTPDALRSFANRPGAEVFAIFIQQPSPEATPLSAHAVTAEDYERFMNKIENLEAPDLLQKLPRDYHDLASAFSRKEANSLPPQRSGIDHEIHTKEGTSPRYQRARPMSEHENNAVYKWLQDQLDAGKIRRSQSPCSSPILIVRKPGGGLRICVDYRALNALTVKNRYPIPLVQETLSRLHGKKYFTKLDIVGAFNRIRIAEGYEWKTAFSTRYGQFECLSMPFGLCNAPATFQSYINDALRQHLDEFCSAYLDDVLIFSDTLEEHKQHVRTIVTKLEQAGLFIDIDKCDFHVKSVKYLGLIITTDGIRMDPAKVESILDWETPRTLKDVQAFLGFANFYRRFIYRFSKLAAPLTNLTRLDKVFSWSSECQTAFETLKTAFTQDPVLAFFDSNLDTMVETDASDAILAGIISQRRPDGPWHPVAYFSKKMTPTECNYEIYDKELLAIVRAFEEWRPELASTNDAVEVITDHKNLEYFTSTKQLNARQARWSEFLSQFNFKIKFRSGAQNVKADTLTRRTQDTSKIDHGHRQQVLLGPERIAASATETRVEDEQSIPEFSTETDNDSTGRFDRLRQYLRDPPSQQSTLAEFRKLRVDPSQCSLRDSDILVQGKRWIQSRTEQMDILHDCHDLPAAGHPGSAKMLELVQRAYFWPGLATDVRRYVANCRTCRATKPSHTAYHGLLNPMPLPFEPWTEIAVDFVTGLPTSTNEDNVDYQNIMTVVDRFTKECHFVPITAMTARNTARQFLRYVFARHGLPSHITSDRGPQFVGDFWRELCKTLRIEQRLSSSYHPQTDGQSERANQSMEQYLRAFVNYAQDDWTEWLPLAEFAVNNHVSESTGVTPFFANTGRHPRMTLRDTIDTPPNDAVGPKKLEINGARAFAATLNALHAKLRQELNLSQHSQADSANNRRQVPHQFQAGDKVFLNTKNLHVARPSRKLDLRFAGPFLIRSRVNAVTYKLELPQSLSAIDNAFHVSLLEPAAANPFPNQTALPPAVEAFAKQPSYQITTILDSKQIKARGRVKKGHERDTFVQYLVRWQGDYHDTWEHARDVAPQAYDLVHAFHQRYPSKPRPQDLVLPDTDTAKDMERAGATTKETEKDNEDNLEDMLANELTDDGAFARAWYGLRGPRPDEGGE